MVWISVSELKAKLSAHLRRVKAGETILVTERGRPVAQLSPPPQSQGDEAGMQELVAAGLVKLGRGRVSKQLWKMPHPPDPNDAALSAVLNERAEGR